MEEKKNYILKAGTGKFTLKGTDIVISIIRKTNYFLDKLIQVFLRLVPEWFKLMSWLIISGAILYVYSKYRLYGFDILFSISFSLIFFYIIFSIGKKLTFSNEYNKKHLLVKFFVSIFSIILPIPLLIFLIYTILGLSLP